MQNLTIEIIEDGNIEPCRELCNELMAFQKSKATIAPEAFDAMNFDTRMKKSFEHALRSQVVVVKDNGVPVAYVFSTIDEIEEAAARAVPAWAPIDPRGGSQGFYPSWVTFPRKIGCLSNLYIRESHRALGLGARLFDMSMAWLESFDDVDLLFIYISNGNDAALDFYLRRGFTYSHDVFGGFIKAVCKLKK